MPMLYDAAAPVLRAHPVHTLEDRVRLLRKLVWLGDSAFNRQVPPTMGGGLRDPRMRQIGLAVTEGCRARDDYCELAAIHWFTKNNIRYTGDVALKDTFQSGWRTMQFGGEDCDGHTILNCVLAMENGFQTKFRITSNYGTTWDHIFALAGVPKNAPRRWVALDTTLHRGSVGTQPPMAKYKDFDVDEVK
jgi:hypothetical protein